MAADRQVGLEQWPTDPQWVEQQSHATDGSDNFRWAIETLDDSTLIGSINTHGCDSRNGAFEYGMTAAEFRALDSSE